MKGYNINWEKERQIEICLFSKWTYLEISCKSSIEL